MSALLTSPVLMLLLQSNDTIGRAVEGVGAIKPELTAYTGITGIFAQFFLVLISTISAFLGSVPGKYGLAIILTVVVVRLLLIPLTRIQIRGMRTMQMLQPVMKEIQRFYPNKQDQSAKTMELYQKFKINPLAGCLPMLIQLPILFGVYRALYDPSFAGKDFLGIQLLFPVNVTSGRSFGIGPDLTDMIDVTVAQLGLHHQIFQLPESIPLIGNSFWYLPALVLVVLYVASSFFMQRVMRKVNAPDPEFADAFKVEMKHKAGQQNEPDMAQQMQKQMGIMNLIIVVFAFIFSAGALLYFIVQNLLMTLEYTLIPKLAAGPALDPKELKAFIKRPPPAKQAKQAEQEQQPVSNPGNQDDGESSEPDEKQEDVSESSGDDAAVPMRLKRPRKKKRKR